MISQKSIVLSMNSENLTASHASGISVQDLYYKTRQIVAMEHVPAMGEISNLLDKIPARSITPQRLRHTLLHDAIEYMAQKRDTSVETHLAHNSITEHYFLQEKLKPAGTTD